MQRALKLFPSLTSYFRSESESQAKFIRLQKVFNDPMSEVYSMFFHSVLPCFTHCNQFLIHVLQPQLMKLLKNLFGKFVKPEIVSQSLKGDGLSSLQFKNSENHVDKKSLVIGFTTMNNVNTLLRQGSISLHQQTVFFNAVKAFLMKAVEYLLKWCPLEDELLNNATWLDFEHRLQNSFLSVQYFVLKYPTIFGSINMDKLNEQFLNYQLLSDEQIPKEVKEGIGLEDDDPHRIDVLWGFLRGMKKPGTNSLEFDHLFKVAEATMTISHSNAGEERILSLINKNKTPNRSSLKLDGTLSSWITVKTHIENPLHWQASKVLLEKAKKATRAYNDKHK
ncbi:uncharacterized protein [Dysidea avara]|uniref:uncharacterized protein n=1 Tax=Dysidea avara TaxID=196820 RepID=UPI003325D9C4